MYQVAYVNSIEDKFPIKTDVVLDGEIAEKYALAIDTLDKYAYLLIMYKIIEGCAEDLRQFRVDKKNNFWMCNKYLLNYANAVFSYREYLKAYNKEVRTVSNDSYTSDSWYRFICDYRNHIVHQSGIVKDYDRRTGMPFIDFDEIVEIQSKQIGKPKNNNENTKRFINVLKDHFPSLTIINGRHYMQPSQLVDQVNAELKNLHIDVSHVEFSAHIKNTLEWLLSIIYIKDGQYKYTILQSESTGELEPSYTIEDFVVNVLSMLGQENLVCQEILTFLIENNYNQLFQYGLNVEDLLIK